MSAKKKKSKAVIKNSPVMLTVISHIAEHRTLQRNIVRSGNFRFDMADHNAGETRKLRKLIQSLGQVADAVEAMESSDSLNNREERQYALTSLAAHTVAWLESLEAA